MRGLLWIGLCGAFAVLGAVDAYGQQDPLRPLDRLYDTELQTRNSPLLVTPEDVKAQEFSGGASFEVSIAVPPGNVDSTPSLSLTYSSLSKNGPYGWGWDLGLSKIERSTRFGPPNYDSPAQISSVDRYEIDGSVLVRDPLVNHRFHKVRNDFAHIRFVSDSEGWAVTSADGTQFLYGSSGNSRVVDPAIPGRVFRWALDEVIAPNGNAYRITYFKDGNQLYPDTIRYSYTTRLNVALGNKQDHRLVRFFWGPRFNSDESDGGGGRAHELSFGVQDSNRAPTDGNLYGSRSQPGWRASTGRSQ